MPYSENKKRRGTWKTKRIEPSHTHGPGPEITAKIKETNHELQRENPAAAYPDPPPGENERAVAGEGQPPGAEEASADGRKGGGASDQGRHGCWCVGSAAERKLVVVPAR